MINLKKNPYTKSLVIETIQSSDRNIVLHFTDSRLVGINYWQGTEDVILQHYKENDSSLYSFILKIFKESKWQEQYEDMNYIHNSPDYWEIVTFLDDCIWDYVNIKSDLKEMGAEIKNHIESITQLRLEIDGIQKGIDAIKIKLNLQ